MSDLLWPGSERAGDLVSDVAVLAAAVAVEQAWLDGLASSGVAPTTSDLTQLVGSEDLAALSAGAEATGNFVPGLVTLLRERSENAWVHRGLTSQDVIDSALMLSLRDAVAEIRRETGRQVAALAGLADTHRTTAQAARTLTQWAVPSTFGLKVANWLTGVLDAADRLDTIDFPAQLGGAAGTMAAAAEIGAPDALADSVAGALGLSAAMPWHTSRSPITAIGDTLTSVTDACGRIASDVLIGSRPEIGELAEAAGGGSSTMPHKRNPALSVLIARAAIAAPQSAATLHLGAALAHDERSSGPWHAEWATLRTLAIRTVVAASQTSEVVAGLRIDVERMAANLETAGGDLRAEQRSMAELAGHAPAASYDGRGGAFIDAAIHRAHTYLEVHA